MQPGGWLSERRKTPNFNCWIQKHEDDRHLYNRWLRCKTIKNRLKINYTRRVHDGRKTCKEISHKPSLAIRSYCSSSTLKLVLDLKTIRFKDMVGRLKTYEDRIKSEDKTYETPWKLLYVKVESSNRNNESKRGRGHELMIQAIEVVVMGVAMVGNDKIWKNRCEESLESEGLESSVCCNCTISETKIFDGDAVSGGSESVS